MTPEDIERLRQEEADRKNTAANNVAMQGRNPAIVARSQRLSKIFGVAPMVVETDPAPFEQQLEREKTVQAVETYPWMTSPLAQDLDLAATFKADDLAKTGDILAGFGIDKPKTSYGFDKPTIGDRRVGTKIKPFPTYIERVGITTGAVIGTAVNNIVNAGLGAAENVTDLVGLNDTLDPVYRGLEEAGRQSNEKLMEGTEGWITPGIKRGAFSAAVSMTQLGATLPAGAAMVLPLLSGITYGNAYQKYQGRGGGIGESMLGAGLEGGLEYATERLPMGYLTGGLGKGTAKDFITHFVLGETLGEQIATAGQSLTDAMIVPENPDLTFKDWLTDPARGQEAWETLVSTTVMSAALGGPGLAYRRLAEASDSAVDTTNALQGQVLLDQAMTKAAAVEARTSSPEEFARFVAQGAANSPVKNVYIPIEAIDAALQDNTLPEEDKAALTFYQDQIEEARVNGGEVVIPIGDALASFAGTKVWESLKDDARVLAGGISGREAREKMETIVEELEAIGQQAVDEAAATTPTLAAKAGVYEDVKAQVLAAGRSAKEAQTTAALFASRAETLASPRYGKFKDAAEAWAWMQLKIVGADTKVGKGRGRKVAQAPFKDLTKLLERDDWALMTAENPNAQQLSPEENAARLTELKQALDGMGLSYTDVRGKYDNEENSLAIEGITEEQARALGARFGQDSVLTRRGLIYGDGTVNPATGISVLDKDADNYFTELPDGTKFAVDIDFDQRVPLKEEVVLQQAELPVHEIPSTIDGALEVARGKKFANQRDFKLAVQKAVNAYKGNKRDRKRLFRLALNDARVALKNNANAVGWYDEKVEQALAVFATIHPEIENDPDARFAFIYALAVTSNGLKVGRNFELADDVYRWWKDNGEMPERGEGTAAAAMAASFRAFNELTKKFDFSGLREIMLRDDITVKELSELTGVTVTGEHKGTKVTGAAFLGPKIGNGFFSNLYGNFDQLTMDRWFIRTWGRWTGTLITEDKAKIKAKRETVKNLIRSLTPAQRKAAEKVLKTKITLADVDGFAKVVANKTASADVREKLAEIHPRLRLDPKNLYTLLDGQKEAPNGPAERNEIRSIMVPVLQELKRDNPELTMADLQAVLWYPEKTLYTTATSGGETAVGYEDDEAPDYANAAVALARYEGVPQEKIDEALKAASERAGWRAEAARRAGRTGWGAGDSVPGFDVVEDAAGFPLEDGLVSSGDGTLDPMVLAQFGGIHGAAKSSRISLALGRAQTMEASGRDAEQIWRLTGWTRGADDLWRFEIDDSQATIDNLPSPEVHDYEQETPGIDYMYDDPRMAADDSDGAKFYLGAKLSEVLDHPALFKHYPQLETIGVFRIPIPSHQMGYFDGLNIVLSEELEEDEIMTTILHELQHAIQHVEGFVNGADPSYIHEIGLTAEYEKQLAHYTAVNNGEVPGWKFPVERTPEQLRYTAAYEVYARVLGEVEARNTQIRHKLSPAQRRDLLPEMTADRDREEWIIPPVPVEMAASQRGPAGPTKTPRGEATFYPDGRTVIQLFKADFSTMLHEMSHVFLQQEFALAQDPAASDELKADIAKLTKWFEANGGALKNGMPDVAAHELFARTGERYFREGKAPSAELRSAFKQFKEWLSDVYKSVKDLLAYGPAPINPEIREIFDRMLATEEAIEANATAPMSQEELGMTTAEYDAYLDSVSTARDTAHDALLERMMKAIRRREDSRMREQRANVRAEVAERVNADPRFIALHLLRTGRWLGDPGREATPVKINTGWLLDNYGDDILSQLPVGLQPIHRGDGVVGDVIAEMVGMGSGNELVEAMLELKVQADELKANGNPRPLRDQLIENETDEIMAERHGDIAMSAEEIEEEAIAALNSNRQGEVLATELRQLRKKNAAPGVVTPYQLLREWARRKVNEGSVSDAVSKTALQRYIRGYNKARRLFEEAILGGKADDAIKQKQAQMINHALLAEGKVVADEINTIVRRMQRYSRTKALASMDQDYLDRIHELLEGYNFRKVSDIARAEKASFETWAEGQRALGHEVHVPPRFRDDRTNYMDAKVAKLLELNDMVQSLAAQGKLKQRLTSARAERELQETIDDIESRILSLPPRTLPEASVGQENRPFRQAFREAKTFGEYRTAILNLMRPGSRVREAATGLLKIEGLMDILDGGKDATGPLNQNVIQPATEAANTFSQLLEEVMVPIVARYRSMSRKQSARLQDFVTIHELTLNVSIHEADTEKLGKPLTIPRMKLLGLLLNTGNLSNLSKLVAGERWGDPESATDLARVRDVLVSYASKEDMDLVQDIWTGVSKLWPHIARVERELSGIVPEQVVPLEFETPFGPYSGGYWPVVWDSTRSEMGKKQGEEAETSLQGVGFGIATPKGHTITRTGAAAPMEWSMESVLFNHMTKVISRVAYAPWVRDTLKVVDNSRVTGAIRLRLGDEYVKAIKPWIRDQIPSNSPDVQGAKSWEKFLNQVRVNMSIAVLGISYSTGVAQALGFGYSAGVLGEGSIKAGGQWMARGIYETLKLQKSGMGGAQEFVFSRSNEMKRRAHEVNQEASEVFRRLRDQDTVVRRMQAAAFWHIGFIDLNVVAIPTWMGGYHKALSQGLTEEEAIDYAEKTVRLSQSSGRQKDLSAIQRGNAGQKFIAMFYTPSSVFFNQQWEAAQHLKAGNWSKALAPTFWFLLMTTLADAMREGDWPEDDEGDGLGGMDIAEWVGRNLLFGAFYGVPVVRDVTNTAERQLRGEYAEYGTTPLSFGMQTIGRGGKATAKMAQGEELEGKDIKAQASAIGFLFGLPGNQVGKSAGFVKDVYDGRVEADSAYDWYHGLAYGKPPAE